MSWVQNMHIVHADRHTGRGWRYLLKVTLTSEEMVAKAWDAYLHKFGAESYVIARYVSPGETMPIDEDPEGLPTAA